MKEVLIVPGGKVEVETLSKYIPDATIPNQPPIVSAGSNQSITLPVSSVTLRGSASDLDGAITSSVWSKISGPNALIAEPNNLQTAISGLIAGSYVFRLTVTDDKGASVSKDTIVTVNAEVVTPPTGTPIPFTPTQLTADFMRPGAGVEQWHNAFYIPVYSQTQGRDKYHRFMVHEIEKGPNIYDWTYFDGRFNEAIDRGGKFSFGFMTVFGDAEFNRRVNYPDGSYSAYPAHWHDMMQADSVKDWKHASGSWIPNWNGEPYLNRLLNFHKTVNNHIETTFYKGVKYADAVGYIDIRGYGQWGEWHTVNIVDNQDQYPAGTRPTMATYKRIVDAHIQGFPNHPLVAMIAALDAGSSQFGNMMNPPEIAHYLLTTKNNWGEIGWRRDQWGATDAYLSKILEGNTKSWNGVALAPLIMDKWKRSYIVGEPPGSNYNNFSDLPRQIKLYHADSFGNGNYGSFTEAGIGANVRAASRVAGYWLTITGGNITGNSITVNWANLQVPVKENYDVFFEIRNGSTVVSLPSKFKPKLFFGTTSVTDTYSNIPTGSLYVVVKDPKGYRIPLPLAITGRQSDGSYLLK